MGGFELFAVLPDVLPGDFRTWAFGGFSVYAPGAERFLSRFEFGVGEVETTNELRVPESFESYGMCSKRLWCSTARFLDLVDADADLRLTSSGFM